MKKSELNKFIREEIISTLSEATEEEVENQVELNKELEKTIKLKDEAGIEEKIAKSVDDVIDPADYVDIGRGYLKGFKRPHSLKDDDLETLGRKIVKVLAKGDINKAKAAFINENMYIDDDEFEMEMGRSKKDSLKKEMIIHVDQLLDGNIDMNDFMNVVEDIMSELNLKEEEDKEPSDAEIRKNKSLAKAAEELAILTREMKSLAKKYSKAEGQEKEDLLKKLKSKTKLKKELDKILDK